MVSRYLMQIVDRTTGEVVSFDPGLQTEHDFVSDCVARAVGLGIGLGRTSDHVAQDIRQAIEDAIRGLKRKVRP